MFKYSSLKYDDPVKNFSTGRNYGGSGISYFCWAACECEGWEESLDFGQ